MRRILWLGGVVLGMVAVLGGNGNAGTISAPSSAATQQVDGNGVTVTATLLEEQTESTAIRLALDTYFVNLVRYDFEELATLRDDTGRRYPVTSVERIGSSLKPRFRQAVLRFPKVAPEAKTIELIVKDVAGVKERVSVGTPRNSDGSAPGAERGEGGFPMVGFLQDYGLWIALGGVFLAMQWFGMGCCGGHRNRREDGRPDHPSGEPAKPEGAAGEPPKSNGSFH